MCIYMYICIYVDVCMCVYVYIYIYIYTYNINKFTTRHLKGRASNPETVACLDLDVPFTSPKAPDSWSSFPD